MRKINLLALSAILVSKVYASSSFNDVRSFTSRNNSVTANNQGNPAVFLNENILEGDGDFSLKECGNNIMIVKISFNSLRDSGLVRDMFLNNNLLRNGPVNIDDLSPEQYRDRIALYESNDADSGRTRFEFLLIRGENTRIENRNYHCLGALVVCLNDNKKSDLVEKLKEKGFYNY